MNDSDFLSNGSFGHLIKNYNYNRLVNV